MAATGEELPDDRWSAFQDPKRKSSSGIKQEEDPGPDLSEYIEKVLKQRSPRKKHEKMYKVAAHLVQLITSIAYALTNEWKLFLKADKKSGVKTAPLRTLTQEKYECMVPLMRPLKPNAFQIVQRGFDEMPPHRCLVRLDPGLSNEEVLLVRKEWEPHVDKNGYLNARGILAWFNMGVSKACSILEAESHNVSCLRFKVNPDGTGSVSAVLTQSTGTSTPDVETDPPRHTDDDADVGMFSVNIFPVFILDRLPPSVQLHSPLPCFGRFVHAQKQLRNLVKEDMENGTMIAVLQPKKEPQAGVIKNNLSKDGPSWQINLSFAEHHIYHILDQFCGEDINFRQILVVYNIIREHYPEHFAKLNNEILVNTLFAVTQKNFSKLTTIQDWFLNLTGALCHGMEIGFLASFYMQRQNMLKVYGITNDEQVEMRTKLAEIMKSIKQDPRHIYDFTGYVERKKGKADSDSDDDDEEDEVFKGDDDDDDKDHEGEKNEDGDYGDETRVANESCNND